MTGLRRTCLDMSCCQIQLPCPDPLLYNPGCSDAKCTAATVKQSAFLFAAHHTKNSTKHQYSELWANKPGSIHHKELQGIHRARQRDGYCINQQLHESWLPLHCRESQLCSLVSAALSHGLFWNWYREWWLGCICHEVAMQKQKSIFLMG